MEEKSKYYVLKEKAVPEVLLKVVEAKRLIKSERAMTIQEATEKLLAVLKRDHPANTLISDF